MIQERRVIIFPRADFLDAMRRYGEVVGKPMPHNPPELFHYDPAQDVALLIKFPVGDGSPGGEFMFSRDDVGSALQAYCKDHKIPLPEDASKNLDKYKDGAALVMQRGSAGLSVMIIDDQEVMRSIIKKLLTKAAPAAVYEASNGKTALEMLKSGDYDPDVIICDLHMDGMDGTEFLRELRADKTNVNNRKPVLILTGDKSEQAKDLTRQVGASKVLTKPISAEDLIRQIMLVRGYFETDKK